MLLPWSGDCTGAHGKDGQSPSLLGDEFCYTVLTVALLGLQSLTKLLLFSFSISDPGASPYLVLRSIFYPLFLKCFLPDHTWRPNFLFAPPALIRHCWTHRAESAGSTAWVRLGADALSLCKRVRAFEGIHCQTHCLPPPAKQ